MALILAVGSGRRLHEVRQALVGHEVASRDSCAGAEGAVDRAPDLVLFAEMVPATDARELCARLRDRTGGRDVPTLTIPAAGDEPTPWDPRAFTLQIDQELYAPLAVAARAMAAFAKARHDAWTNPVPDVLDSPIDEAPAPVSVPEPEPAGEPESEREPWLGPLVASAGRGMGSAARTVGRPLVKWGARAAVVVLVLGLAGAGALAGRPYVSQWLRAWRQRSAAPNPAATSVPAPAAAATPPPAPDGRSDRPADLDSTPGWVAVFAPIELTATDGGQPLIMDDHDEIMLPPGPHEIHFSNQRFGFEDVEKVTVQPGAMTRVTIVPPKSSISISASVPADVSIDGQSVGRTPIVDLPIDLGTREIVLKAASGEERRRVVPITVTPVAVDVDFSQP